MKIKFFNLGTIKETELDLRPLTIIIGPNNSNKTYIAYSIYGLWKHSFRNSYEDSLPGGFQYHRKDNTLSLKIDDRFVQRMIELGQEYADLFTNELATFYQDSSRQLFAKTKLEISITPAEIRKALLRLTSKPFGDKVGFNLSDDLLTIDESKITADSFGFFLLLLDMELFSRPFVLPAERNAFIITYKLLANRRLKLLIERERRLFGSSRASQERQLELLKEQGDIRYPQPIEDFLEFLTDIELESREPNQGEFAELAEQIERYIQNDNKTEFKQTRFGGKEIMVQVNEDLRIDLYNASSSIKQIAPLLLYLRYRASRNDLLIIDEPEMNLHPESQVRLLEILAILVNAGVNVLVTTHSPYFLAHLNNLARSDEQPASVRENQAEALYLRDVRAFLSMEQVSAYEMKDNELRSLKDNEFGIRWDTLSDVSVDVQQKYFEIDALGKAPARARAK